MRAAIQRNSLAAFQRARTLLQQLSGQLAREHPLAAALGLLIYRADLPALGDPAAVGSGGLSNRIQAVYSKSTPFDEGVGAGAMMRRAGFGEIALPAGNDWRNAFGSQKGLGCFGSDDELTDLAFRHAARTECPHRTLGEDGDRCDLSPGAQPSRCKSVEEHAGEVPKLLQIVPVGEANYNYKLIHPDGEDLRKFLSGVDRIPMWPFLQAFYSGGSIRSREPVITSTELLADLGLAPIAAEQLFDDSPNNPANREIIRMSEPYLLASLRRRLYEAEFSITFPDLINFYLSLMPRAFVILSGISGTGKSRLPRLFAEHIRPVDQPELANFSLVPVRPGWNDVADLMGYYNSIHGGFEPGPVLDAFAKAGLGGDGHGQLPILLLLDELNLSRVEHYFADFLSVMESRRERNGSWITDPLQLAGGRTGLINFIGIEEPTQPFVDGVEAQLPIPDNLFIVGTVNVDESTQGISNKVLDRANTIELENVTFNPVEPIAPAGYEAADLHLLGHSLVSRAYRTLEDARAAHQEVVNTVTERLTKLNDVLVRRRLHFGRRTHDEICIYMAYAQDFCAVADATDVDLEGFDSAYAFDRQILQKVLPRVSGTREELQFGPEGNLFEQLDALLTEWGAKGASQKLARMKGQELVNFWEA